jgi:AraC-like DNA-binding protein
LDDLNREAILRLLINPFIAEGLRESPEKQDTLARFETIIAYIEKNSHNRIKTAELAKMMSLQPTYFSNLFAKNFGMPPVKYISQVRMNKAQVLLEHTSTPVKNIAQEVGYDDELYFSRVFKRHVGLSPTAYRRQRRLNSF